LLVNKLEKILIGFIFSLLFSFFVILSSLNFPLLNDKFLFYVFEKHNLYERIPKELGASFINDPNLSVEEKLGYTLIIRNIPPNTFEKILKTNITSALKFVHGKSSDMVIYFPAKELRLGPQDLSWSFSQNSPPNTKGTLSLINGIWTKLFTLWFVTLLSLIGLFFLYGKASLQKLAGRRLLIINGTILYILGALLFVIPQLLAQTMPSKLEPSQALIKILFSTLIPEIALTWLISGVVVFMIGFSILLIERRKK